MWNLAGGLTARAFLANLAVGVWFASLVASWIFAIAAVLAAFRDNRRLVGALRWSTIACIVELMGLLLMVFIPNPERWKAGAWWMSLIPIGIALTGVVLASIRPEIPAARCEPGEGHA